MKPRRWGLLALWFVGLGLLIWQLGVSGRLRGWLAGEAFFRGVPSHVWAERLTSKDPIVLRETLAQLDRESQALDVLLDFLDSRHSFSRELRPRAAELLGKLGPQAKQAVPALLDAMDHANVHEQALILRALAAIEPSSPRVLNLLVAHLEGPNQMEVLELFVRLPGGIPEAIPTLKTILEQGSDPGQKALACQALGQLKQHAVSAVPLLCRLASDSDAQLRERSIEALGRIGQSTSEVLAVLQERLKDPVAAVRQASARSLGWLGPQAKAAGGALEKLLGDPDPEVRRRVKQALSRIQGVSP